MIILIYYAMQLYKFALLLNILFSWVRPNPSNPFVAFIYRITEPPLELIRRFIPFAIIGSFDLSPIILFFILHLLTRLLVKV